MQRKMIIRGFTLIELLIVVAIIGILAAIAIPNFLQAQTRAKIAKANADMHTIATALTQFQVDRPGRIFPAPSTASLPMDQSWHMGFCGPHFNDPCGSTYRYPRYRLFELTTPIEYLTSVPGNPFPDADFSYNFPDEARIPYRYFSENWKDLIWSFNPGLPSTPFVYAIASHGPDGRTSLGEWLMFGEEVLNAQPSFLGSTAGCIYDPTNGTVSNGDIIRVGP